MNLEAESEHALPQWVVDFGPKLACDLHRHFGHTSRPKVHEFSPLILLIFRILPHRDVLFPASLCQDAALYQNLHHTYRMPAATLSPLPWACEQFVPHEDDYYTFLAFLNVIQLSQGQMKAAQAVAATSKPRD